MVLCGLDGIRVCVAQGAPYSTHHVLCLPDSTVLGPNLRQVRLGFGVLGFWGVGVLGFRV